MKTRVWLHALLMALFVPRPTLSAQYDGQTTTRDVMGDFQNVLVWVESNWAATGASSSVRGRAIYELSHVGSNWFLLGGDIILNGETYTWTSTGAGPGPIPSPNAAAARWRALRRASWECSSDCWRSSADGGAARQAGSITRIDGR